MSFDVTPTGPKLPEHTPADRLKAGADFARTHAPAVGRATAKGAKASWPFLKWLGRVWLWIVFLPYGIVRSLLHGRRKDERKLQERRRPPEPEGPSGLV